LKTTQHLSFQITEVAAVSLPNIVWGYPYSQLILSDGWLLVVLESLI